MASLAKRLLRPLRALRPRFAHEVETVVSPAYARRDELVSAIEDVRRLLADQLDGDNEATAVLGRVLARVQAGVEGLEADVARLSDQVARIEASLTAAAAAPGQRAASSHTR